MKISIQGTGSYVPEVVKVNDDFLGNRFLDVDGSTFEHSSDVIIQKFQAITGIKERRYADANLKTSDMGFLASERAIEQAGIDKESIDYIIFAHNFGDLTKGHSQGDVLPSLASRVKNLLRIENPNCVAYDVIFGCPGWLQGVIQAYAHIKSGLAQTCLVIGGETLSRIIDPHDRDSMIYGDGAGATIIQATDSGGEIVAMASQTYAQEEAYHLFFGKTYDQNCSSEVKYLKMHGRKIYEFACTYVPQAMKSCLDKSGIEVEEIKKIFLHQANQKMDEAIVKRFYRLYGKQVPQDVMPMMIEETGNSSVATIPTLFDMVLNDELKPHKVEKGDLIMFASVGAGMNINCFVYRM